MQVLKKSKIRIRIVCGIPRSFLIKVTGIPLTNQCPMYVPFDPSPHIFKNSGEYFYEATFLVQIDQVISFSWNIHFGANIRDSISLDFSFVFLENSFIEKIQRKNLKQLNHLFYPQNEHSNKC